MAENQHIENTSNAHKKKKQESSQSRVKSLFNSLNDQMTRLEHGGSLEKAQEGQESLEKQEASEPSPVGNPSPNQEVLAVVEQFAEQVETSPAIEPFENDPLYRSMISSFQRGKWDQGLAELEQLVKKYPFEQDLTTLSREIELRARYDKSEALYSTKVKRERLRKLGLQVFILAFIFFVVFGAAFTYNTYFLEKINEVRQRVASDQQAYALKVKFNNAQQLLVAFRPEEALKILEEIQSSDPNYPGLNTSLDQAHSLLSLDSQYSEAVQKKADRDLAGALAILQEIEAKHPGYRDVTLQTKEIQRMFSLDDLIDLADAAVRASNWDEAIKQYEEVRNRDLSYQANLVEERLYYSYITAAQKLLFEQPDSLDALNTAQEYYSKALSIRPQDTTVIEELAAARETIENRLYNKYVELARQSLVGKADSLEALQAAEKYFAMALKIRPFDAMITQEREMARQFLQAQDDFNKKNWDGAISNLESLYQLSPEYAGGTARQTLYDAYIQRGDYYMLSGRSQLALEDYRKAMAVAELKRDSQIRLFEAQVKIADALAIMGGYDAAIYQYRAAMDSSGINQVVLMNLDLVNSINEADEFTRRGMYQAAYNIYHEVMKNIVDKFKTVTHVVESGDYLTQLANYYQTTTSAILKANNISNPSDLSIGERIIIPVLP